MGLLEDKRAILKFSFFVLSAILLVSVIIFASGVLAATHISTVELQPEWSTPGVTNDYEAEICNTDGDSIDEVRIMQNPLYTDFDCDQKSDWTLIEVSDFPDPELGIIDICWYFTDDDNSIPEGDCETFEFEATAPDEDPVECLLDWKFETRDDEDFWMWIYDTTSIDSEPPVTTKTLGEPKIIEGEVEWISTSTPITLDPVDMSLDCGIGVDKTWYLNVIDLTENACWYPHDYCNPIEQWPGEFVDGYSPYDSVACIDGECQEADCVGYDPNTPDWYDCVETCAYTLCGIDPLWKLYRGEPIYKPEESCHILQYFSVDHLGNKEDYQTNCFFVDDTPPEVAKNNGDALEDYDLVAFPETNGTFHWINPEMPISFMCRDPDPHPVNHEELCFKVSYDYPNWGYITDDYCEDPLEEGYCCVDATPDEPFAFYFNENEDSIHNLEYYCRDGVYNEGPEHLQFYRVDSLPPIIEKDMFGSYLGDCPNGTDLEHGDCYVADDGTSGVDISVYDDTTYPECAVGGIMCTYEVWWNDGLVDAGEFSDTKRIIFEYDSTHTLIVRCEDALGNYVYDEEEFLVDSTPPETTKTYGEPYYPADINVPGPYPHYITSQTPISFAAVDEKVGVDTIYWGYMVVDDNWCETEYSGCHNYEGRVENLSVYVPGQPVMLPEESCHLIEFYATDLLGNVEPTKRQCVFVENKPPVTTKSYEPDAYIDPSSGLEYIDTQHVIVLDAYDQDPHPSGVQEKQYRVSGALANSFCENCADWMTSLRPDMGAWQTYEGPFGIAEESCHVIEYRSIDNLDQEEPIQWQCVFVDKDGPTITKHYEGPQYPDPIAPDTSYPHYITSETNVVISAFDEGPHPSGVSSVNYSVSLLGDEACYDDLRCQEANTDSSWQPYDTAFTIGEDSCHVIEIRATDNVGKESYHRQCVFVDNKEPLIEKIVSDPQVDGETPIHKYLTDESVIRLECADQDPHPVGYETIHWEMYWKYDDCENVDNDWQLIDNGTNPDFKEFSGLSDSCHKFVYWCEDALGNTQEEPEVEIDVVDNQAPEPNKTVGETKIIWDGSDGVFYPDEYEHCWDYGHPDFIECYKVTMDTPITLDCNDPEPHPVNHEKTCFMVGLDGDDATLAYCGELGGSYNESTGYCCGFDAPYEFSFMEESEHNLKFYCEDKLGNRGPVDEEKFKVYGKMFEIELNKKWNLISFPFDPLDCSVEEVFKEINESIESVVTYDGATSHWSVYRPDGEGPNDLDTIKAGNGYWVMAKEEATLFVGGSLYSPGDITPASKTLVEGWNLIGYYGTEEELSVYSGPEGNGDNAYCHLYSLRNLDGGLINPTNWNSLLTYWELDNPEQWEELGICEEMDPGAGYWIAMDTDDTYNPQTVCPSDIINSVCGFI